MTSKETHVPTTQQMIGALELLNKARHNLDNNLDLKNSVVFQGLPPELHDPFYHILESLADLEKKLDHRYLQWREIEQEQWAKAWIDSHGLLVLNLLALPMEDPMEFNTRGWAVLKEHGLRLTEGEVLLRYLRAAQMAS